MSTKRSANNSATNGQRKLNRPRAYNLVGTMNFVLTSAMKVKSKRGGDYWVGTYDVEYRDKQSGEIKLYPAKINSAIELPPDWVGKKVYVQVKITRRYDADAKREYENYYIVEAELAGRPA